MAAKKAWTSEQDTNLLRLWPTNSASEIGRELGKTRNAVIGRFHRLQGDYDHYVSPAAQAIQAERARTRAIFLTKETQAIERAKKLVAGGTSRNKAIFLARNEGARLAVVGEHFGLTGERVRQIAEATA